MKKMKYILPAEWETHKSTIICWPHQKEDWPGKFAPIQWVYTEIIKNIIPDELVRVIVQSTDHKRKVEKILLKCHIDLSCIQFIILQTDRGWMRDSSPALVKSGNKITALSMNFNGWAKYDNYKKDKNIPGTIAKSLGIDLQGMIYKDKNVILEGGAIDTNGCGTLITTEECLLDNNIQTRNPGFTKKDYANLFENYFGITNIIWLGKGIAGDDTHGHIDDVCRFVNKNTVVICNEETNDENKVILEDNIERLQNSKLENGSKLNIIKIPMPSPIIFDNLRVPASYANFYICNKSVLVPTFNDPNDRIALNIMADLFPTRKIIGIHAVDLIWGLGTIHCLTHEEVASEESNAQRAKRIGQSAESKAQRAKRRGQSAESKAHRV
jgi:agmatine deiminase